ncbi:peptide chain release factor N(5)-glutamine methyltransferase [Rhodobacter sp. 24-YEA-8]|uniref:peptide chain release factor N(5)-glutamine methyltransferase n=1 Tax=Rhodobacter sp. 24-YEA-8 TaxID=1884310 RepID=UPI00089CEF0C|nr:peptide chain release factor N(5)-glutamine methyltransferase [Rhodobacter sp. 24-YEA-8]SEB89882.1 [protein release factor]-glutamine N5-methyltransferase [Rhodobacter sp. 24-YEA-8]
MSTGPGRLAKLVLAEAVAQLRAAGVEDPARDARLLLAHAIGIGPERLLLHLADPLDHGSASRFDAAVLARAARMPVSQIVGQRLFYGRSFIVTADTLDPRPETEILISEALRLPFSQVIDLGTGTGAILLTLLAENPAATGIATDISAAALDVARRNAEALDLSGRADFVRTSWLDGVTEKADLIVSNPPYITLDAMAGLEPEVRDHEPHLALTDFGDGLSAYRAIATQAPAALRPGGRLIVEVGWDQGRAVAEIFAAGGFKNVDIIQDFDGKDRVVSAIAAA